jgi:hypothetical protein
MPDRIKLLDLLDRGLGAAGDEPGLVVPARASVEGDGGEEMAGRLRDLVGGAERSPDLAGFFDAVSAASDPQSTASAFIEAKYTALGGPSGLLGSSATAVTSCPDGIGFFRHFRGGSIYWRPETGAHEIHGPIKAKWAQLGWERSFLGYPTSDVISGIDPGQRGLQSHFQGGMVLWHPERAGGGEVHPPVKEVRFALASQPRLSGKGLAGVGLADDLVVLPEKPESAEGAYEVHGAIAAHYQALGGSASILGYPTTDETGTPDGIGRFNHFEAGSIYWTPNTGAHEVHGLIRQLWAEHGWERNPSLGYPINDELVPDRRIGHRHPEPLRKPIAEFPTDVVKLPKEAPAAGFSPLIANLSASTSRRPILAAATAATPAATAVSRAGEVTKIKVLSDGASSPAAEQSQNRFGDFENGVLFWRRGAAAAQQLQPWTRSTAGESMGRSAAEVLEAMRPSLDRAFANLPEASLTGFSFAGTAAYSWDGTGVRNRRHRVLAGLVVTQHVSVPLGPDISMPVPLSAELELEVSFEPLKRLVTVGLADWRLPAMPTFDSAPLTRALHERLDNLLFEQVTLIELPDTSGGKPVAVLSVKTMPDGGVAIFIEPSSTPLEDLAGKRTLLDAGMAHISVPIGDR